MYVDTALNLLLALFLVSFLSRRMYVGRI